MFGTLRRVVSIDSIGLSDHPESLGEFALCQQEQLDEKSSLIDAQAEERRTVREYIRLLKHQRLGRKSEQASDEQSWLFNEAEATAHDADEATDGVVGDVELAYRFAHREPLAVPFRGPIGVDPVWAADGVSGIRLDVNQLGRKAHLAIVAANSTPLEWMPTILDHHGLPDMGRMTVRLSSGGRITTGAGPSGALRGARICAA